MVDAGFMKSMLSNALAYRVGDDITDPIRKEAYTCVDCRLLIIVARLRAEGCNSIENVKSRNPVAGITPWSVQSQQWTARVTCLVCFHYWHLGFNALEYLCLLRTSAQNTVSSGRTLLHNALHVLPWRRFNPVVM